MATASLHDHHPDTPAQHHTPQALSADSPPTQPASKRQRVALACQRCKTRKQKCDGSHPKCSSCLRTSSECRYERANIPNATKHKLYIEALEERIAELESGLSYHGQAGVADDHWERLQPQEDISNSLSSAIRELSLGASGFYVGGTAHITLGRLLGSAFPISQTLTESGIKRKAGTEPSAETGKFLDVPLFSKPNVEILFQAYMQYVAPEYPIIHSRRLRDMHARRSRLYDVWEAAILHFVYAIGGSALRLSGKSGDYAVDEHHESAMKYRESVVHFLDRRSVIYLSLASIYSLQAPTSPGPWVLILFAVELCIMLGLHRKASIKGIGLGSELDKRLFWSVYSLDRHSSLSMGRPPAISDHDIDTPLPLDIDEDCVLLEGFREALSQDHSIPSSRRTTLTDFINNLKLRRIQSRIQHSVYRVDESVDPSHHTIDQFLSQLSLWLETAAPELKPSQDGERHGSIDLDEETFRSRALYMIQYHLTVRLLLFPQLSVSPVNSHYVQVCANACIGVCETYKRLHLGSETLSLPPAVTQWLFLSGLTLIYCMWISPKDVVIPTATSAIQSCSNMLYVMAERWPPAQQHRNAFEGVKESILEHISSAAHVPRDPLPSSTFNSTTQDALRQAFASAGMESLGQAIHSITGFENPPSDEQFFSGITTEADHLAFGLDNLGPMVSGSNWVDYGDEVEAGEAPSLDFQGGSIYNLDMLDVLISSQGPESSVSDRGTT